MPDERENVTNRVYVSLCDSSIPGRMRTPCSLYITRSQHVCVRCLSDNNRQWLNLGDDLFGHVCVPVPAFIRGRTRFSDQKSTRNADSRVEPSACLYSIRNRKTRYACVIALRQERTVLISLTNIRTQN